MNLGGGFQGISPQQTLGNEKRAEDVMLRRIVSKSWNTAYARGKVNGMNSRTTPYRAVNNLGDFLSRQNYSCGGSNQINSRPGLHGLMLESVPQHCDGTGIPASSTNVKWVSDCSDYIAFKKQRQANVLYNDKAMGGKPNRHVPKSPTFTLLL
jgi:hypothetical protein